MPLIVEDGTGVAGANSYVTLVEAQDYISVVPSFERVIWDALLQAQREDLLIYSTRTLNNRAKFAGDRSFPTTQSLQWPRKCATDCEGITYPEDVIPGRIKSAVIEMALFYSKQGNSASAISDSDGLKSATIDVLSFTWMDGYDASSKLRFPPGLNKILCDLGHVSSNTSPKQAVPIRRS
jgi:hypothetical protein